MESHLLQMRGLKLKLLSVVLCKLGVASFTDAWIETAQSQPNTRIAPKSHLLQMRGLKLHV